MSSASMSGALTVDSWLGAAGVDDVSPSLSRALATAALRAGTVSAAEFDQRLEHVERQLFGVDDLAKVMKGSTALSDIVDRDVVLPQNVVRFVLRHGLFS
jgi:hypothetical protein